MRRFELWVATLIFLFVNVIGVGTAFLVTRKLEAGDILSFEGAVLGAAGAVLGAIYVEDRKRRIAATEELQPIKESLQVLIEALERAVSATTLREIRASDLEHASQVVDKIFGHYPPKSVPVLLQYEKFRFRLALVVKSAAATKSAMIGGNADMQISDGVRKGHEAAIIETKKLLAAYN